MRTRPDKLTEVKLPGGTVQVDEYGYITNPDLWSEDFARWVAEREGIGALGDKHWEMIGFVRDLYADHGVAPDQRHLLKYLSRKYGTDKHGAKDILFAHFPSGYVKQTVKAAGMRQPRAWSTG
ncbi:MAG TPA: TusE/DsrC/DsvC family sulfur relay protein [Rhodobacteraceae bacterium]|nr:TusE/DsrC/DsvC family sulfur relay protein [Paracoccaceae bacterium]